MRMWGVGIEQKMDKLSSPTEIFDNCGAYDRNEGIIPKGSVYPSWKDALSFLEWYGIPEMAGFGIIIIDDTNPALYTPLIGKEGV